MAIDKGTFCKAYPIIQIPRQFIKSLLRTDLNTTINKQILIGSLMLIYKLLSFLEYYFGYK